MGEKSAILLKPQYNKCLCESVNVDPWLTPYDSNYLCMFVAGSGKKLAISLKLKSR